MTDLIVPSMPVDYIYQYDYVISGGAVAQWNSESPS